MKGSGKPAKPMGKYGAISRIPLKPKMTKKAVSTSPACGHKSAKAGPFKGM